ncbi:hypothetical protein CPHO_08045 [Corynebacterium phocae]|uniref:DUF4245 domain-containing protein n=1 Tax=Corynebacterium phocae TaxID=161895 RepID=A0A1L7D3Y1_9CORY|nr:DUF4245 domain-containing protein [Corynebacterium phocae]APT92844.1 hypothetical protein CPHO_08045 [Corynebacterium phocae]KAA8723163.1 DUF4245 domain-containing protein [Corynebacterium phocae]
MAAEEKPKIFEDTRDIVLSLGVVVVMMGLAVGATGLCSVNPEETEYARINEVDASTFLDLESRGTKTVIRDPEMPAGWTPNSARRTSVAGEIASAVGWVTADDGFVQSVQTSVPLEDALKNYDGHYRPEERTVTVEGKQVRVLSTDEKNVRDLWGVDLGDARLLLSGSSKDADFETAVRAFIAATPLNNA